MYLHIQAWLPSLDGEATVNWQALWLMQLHVYTELMWPISSLSFFPLSTWDIIYFGWFFISLDYSDLINKYSMVVL